MKKTITQICCAVCVLLSQQSFAQAFGAEMSAGTNFHQHGAFYSRGQAIFIALPVDLRLTLGVNKMNRQGQGPGVYCANCPISWFDIPFSRHQMDERMLSFYTLAGKSIALNRGNSLRMVASAGPALVFHSKVGDFRPRFRKDASGHVWPIPNNYDWDRKDWVTAGLTGDLRFEWVPLKFIGLFISGHGQLNPIISSYSVNVGLQFGRLK